MQGPSANEGVASQVVNLVADLKPIDTNSFQEAYVIGTTVIGDGGQGHFFYSSTSTESDNGIDVIEPTVGGGRWLLQNNAHNSFIYEAASGTTDAITINPTPIISTIDNTRVFFVESLGKNTGPATFKVGTNAALSLLIDNATALNIGDTGPAGYVMIIKPRDSGASYRLMNPYMVKTDQYVPNSVDQAAMGPLSVGTPELIDNGTTYAKMQNISAGSTVLGRASGAGAGDPTELSVAQLKALVFPTGGFISMWSGTLASIPTGWSFCDGTSGTPDLRDQFILSVGAAENPGASGGVSNGSTSVTTGTSGGTPTGTNTGTALTVAQMPAHTHDVAVSTANNAGGGGSATTAPGGTTTSTSQGSGATHTHTFTGDALGLHTHNSQNNYPLFFKLAFIMYTG